MTAPTLHTARLTLTAHTRVDLDDLATMWGDPAVTAMIGGPRSREETWIRLLRSAGQWALFGYGAWTVRETATGRFVGDLGLLEAERAIDPPLRVPEVGWALAPAFQGRGMAREALTAALDWADGHGIAATCCIIDPANAPSIRLAERLGFARTHEATYKERPIITLERRA